MTTYAVIFYILSLLIIASTVIAITRKNPVHTIVYLVISFFGSAMIFYISGAPLLASLEVIVYAGAIMILFLFIVMMIKTDNENESMFPKRQLFPALGISGLYLILILALHFTADAKHLTPMKTAYAKPVIFGHYLFQNHWLGIEIISLLLLIAIIGALHLGKD